MRILPANQDMIDGYVDGRADNRMEFPESLSNRGAAYRHGWLSGLADRCGGYHQAGGYDYDKVRAAADEAMRKDSLPK